MKGKVKNRKQMQFVLKKFTYKILCPNLWNSGALFAILLKSSLLKKLSAPHFRLILIVQG